MSRTADDPTVVRILGDGLTARQRELLAQGRIEWVNDAAMADLTANGSGNDHPVTTFDDLAGSGQALSNREVEVLGYLADGWSNEEIASRLGIGLTTVKFHLAAMYRKMGVNRRTEAVREGQKRGMIEW